MESFYKKVVDVVTKIPKGAVLSYGEVARRSGNAKAARAVGTLMARNIDISIPCHRVVRADGSVGMYNGLQGKSKYVILKKEGVTFKENGKVVLSKL